MKNFKTISHLQTALLDDKWVTEKIATEPLGIYTLRRLTWYKRFPKVRPLMRLPDSEEPDKTTPIRIHLEAVNYTEVQKVQEHGRYGVTLSLRAEEVSGEWVNLQVYSIGLTDLNIEKVNTYCQKLINAWVALNYDPAAVTVDSKKKKA